MKLLLEVNNFELFYGLMVYHIYQEEIIADNYHALVMVLIQLGNYIYMITTVKHLLLIKLFLFNFASGLANRISLRKLLRSYGSGKGQGDLTTPTTLSIFQNRRTRSKPTSVSRALTNVLHKCHKSQVGIELTISKVKGACPDDCATWSLLFRIKQSYTRNLNSLAWACVSL